MIVTIDRTNLDVWAERDRTHIALRLVDGSEFKDGPIIAEWWDEEAHEMFEQGFFTAKGVIMGRLINPRPLHESVYEYCKSVGLLPEDPRVRCCDCGGTFTRKRKHKGNFKCEYCVEQHRKDNPDAHTAAEWRSWLRSARTFQEA